MAKLTQAEFEVKHAARRANLARIDAKELAAAVEKQGFRDVDHLMDLCATNEPAKPFADGGCSDEALEFIAMSIEGCMYN